MYTPIPSNEIKCKPILAIKYRYNLTPLLLKTGNIEGTPIHIMQKNCNRQVKINIQVNFVKLSSDNKEMLQDRRIAPNPCHPQL